MAAKSPTTSVRSREMIGGDQFSQRREVFDKHDTMFVPLPSPTTVLPVYKDVEPIVTSNHGKTTSNFKRNTAGYSSMRESRNEDRNYDFRPRKYSDNFTSELNQRDDVEYRHTMTERTRRLSKLRREFLNSNLHEPNSTFTRSGVRASMPTNSTSPIKYKIESPNLYKFPFAEPYTTPTPVRRVIVDLGPADEDNLSEGKENKDPEEKIKYHSLSSEGSPTKVDHHKLFEELVKRYSPQRKTVDWTLPPTMRRPRVVGSVPKSTSSAADSLDTKASKEKLEITDNDEVFEKKEDQKETEKPAEPEVVTEVTPQVEIIQNGPENIKTDEDTGQKDAKTNDSKASLIAAEAEDHVPELFTIQMQISRESSPASKKPPLETITDLTIPEMIKKMTAEGECLEIQKNDVKKVKRKRSFLDKLLGRNKGNKN
ncbi:uncharacterized protein [Epargyreus clarus]|uniref:uncharacterized protein n=1 Tax=Epargyreus clarus TaxID=520877 RepID=UPI003C2BD1DB